MAWEGGGVLLPLFPPHPSVAAFSSPSPAMPSFLRPIAREIGGVFSPPSDRQLFRPLSLAVESE